MNAKTIWLAEPRGLSEATTCPPKLISHWSSSRVSSSPLLFTIDTTLLSNMISGYAIPDHLYAADSRLYVFLASGDSAAALDGLPLWLTYFQTWMLRNKLNWTHIKLNHPLSGTNVCRGNISLFPIEPFSIDYPNKICSESWQKLHFPVKYICSLHFMYWPHQGFAENSLLPWSSSIMQNYLRVL